MHCCAFSCSINFLQVRRQSYPLVMRMLERYAYLQLEAFESVLVLEDGAPPKWGLFVCVPLVQKISNRWTVYGGLNFWPDRPTDVTP